MSLSLDACSSRHPIVTRNYARRTAIARRRASPVASLLRLLLVAAVMLAPTLATARRHDDGPHSTTPMQLWTSPQAPVTVAAGLPTVGSRRWRRNESVDRQQADEDEDTVDDDDDDDEDDEELLDDERLAVELMLNDGGGTAMSALADDGDSDLDEQPPASPASPGGSASGGGGPAPAIGGGVVIKLEERIAAVFNKVAYGLTTTKRSIPDNVFVPSLTTVATPPLTTYRYRERDKDADKAAASSAASHHQQQHHHHRQLSETAADDELDVDVDLGSAAADEFPPPPPSQSAPADADGHQSQLPAQRKFEFDLERDHALPTSAPNADILKSNNNPTYPNPNRNGGGHHGTGGAAHRHAGGPTASISTPGPNGHHASDGPRKHPLGSPTASGQQQLHLHHNGNNGGPKNNAALFVTSASAAAADGDRPVHFPGDMPSYSPPARTLNTPPLPPSYQSPFADKPTLRGTNSDAILYGGAGSGNLAAAVASAGGNGGSSSGGAGLVGLGLNGNGGPGSSNGLLATVHHSPVSNGAFGLAGTSGGGGLLHGGAAPNRRPIPPPSLTPGQERIPYRPPELIGALNGGKHTVAHESPSSTTAIAADATVETSAAADRKKALNTPYGQGKDAPAAEHGSSASVLHFPSISRILSGSNGRKEDIPEVLLRTVTAKPLVSSAAASTVGDRGRLPGDGEEDDDDEDPDDDEDVDGDDEPDDDGGSRDAEAAAAADDDGSRRFVGAIDADDEQRPNAAAAAAANKSTQSPLSQLQPTGNHNNADQSMGYMQTTQSSQSTNNPNSALGTQNLHRTTGTSSNGNGSPAPSQNHQQLHPSAPGQAAPHRRPSWTIAWNVHVYLSAILFTVLAVYSIFKMIFYDKLTHLVNQSYFICVHLVLIVICLARIFFLCYDAYNIHGSFAPFVAELLLNLPATLLSVAFATLMLFLLVRSLNRKNNRYAALMRPLSLVIGCSVHVGLCVTLHYVESSTGGGAGMQTMAGASLAQQQLHWQQWQLAQQQQQAAFAATRLRSVQPQQHLQQQQPPQNGAFLLPPQQQPPQLPPPPPPRVLSLICQIIYIIVCAALGLFYLYVYRHLKRVLRTKSQNYMHGYQNLSYAIHITIATALLFVLLAALQVYGAIGVTTMSAQAQAHAQAQAAAAAQAQAAGQQSVTQHVRRAVPAGSASGVLPAVTSLPNTAGGGGADVDWLQCGYQFSLRLIEIAIVALLSWVAGLRTGGGSGGAAGSISGAAKVLQREKAHAADGGEMGPMGGPGTAHRHHPHHQGVGRFALFPCGASTAGTSASTTTGSSSTGIGGGAAGSDGPDEYPAVCGANAALQAYGTQRIMMAAGKYADHFALDAMGMQQLASTASTLALDQTMTAGPSGPGSAFDATSLRSASMAPGDYLNDGAGAVRRDAASAEHDHYENPNFELRPSGAALRSAVVRPTADALMCDGGDSTDGDEQLQRRRRLLLIGNGGAGTGPAGSDADDADDDAAMDNCYAEPLQSTSSASSVGYDFQNFERPHFGSAAGPSAAAGKAPPVGATEFRASKNLKALQKGVPTGKQQRDFDQQQMMIMMMAAAAAGSSAPTSGNGPTDHHRTAPRMRDSADQRTNMQPHYPGIGVRTLNNQPHPPPSVSPSGGNLLHHHVHHHPHQPHPHQPYPQPYNSVERRALRKSGTLNNIDPHQQPQQLHAHQPHQHQQTLSGSGRFAGRPNGTQTLHSSGSQRLQPPHRQQHSPGAEAQPQLLRNTIGRQSGSTTSAGLPAKKDRNRSNVDAEAARRAHEQHHAHHLHQQAPAVNGDPTMLVADQGFLRFRAIEQQQLLQQQQQQQHKAMKHSPTMHLQQQ